MKLSREGISVISILFLATSSFLDRRSEKRFWVDPILFFIFLSHFLLSCNQEKCCSPYIFYSLCFLSRHFHWNQAAGQLTRLHGLQPNKFGANKHGRPIPPKNSAFSTNIVKRCICVLYLSFLCCFSWTQSFIDRQEWNELTCN